MTFEQDRFEGGDDDAAEIERLSSVWLADLRAIPDFTPQDEYLLDRIIKSDRAASVFAARQKLRQQRLESTGGEIDIINDELRMLRDVFGKP